MRSNINSLDGLALWFFGGTPGPDDLDSDCTLADPIISSIDEDDAKIAAFAHRCHCGHHKLVNACQQKKPLKLTRKAPPSPMSLLV